MASSPTIDELTSPDYAPRTLRKSLKKKALSVCTILPSHASSHASSQADSPTVDTICSQATMETAVTYGPCPSLPSGTESEDNLGGKSTHEDATESLHKRTCRKSKTEANSMSKAQCYKSPKKRKRKLDFDGEQTSQKAQKSVNGKTPRSKKSKPGIKDAKTDKESYPSARGRKRTKSLLNPPVMNLLNVKEDKGSDCKNASNSKQKTTKKSSKRSSSLPRHPAPMDLKSDSNRQEASTSRYTSTMPRPRKRGLILDTSWLDEEDTGPQCPLMHREKRTLCEDEESSAGLSGSQHTYSSASSIKDLDEVLDDNDDDDDEDDLPDVLGMSAKGTPPLKRGDLIWIKFRKFPHWPAIVKLVYRKKKRIVKFTVAFIGSTIAKDLDQPYLRLNYKKHRVTRFGSNQHKTFVQEGMDSDFRESFEESLQEAESFLFKKAKEDVDVFEYFSHLFKALDNNQTLTEASLKSSPNADQTLLAATGMSTPEGSDAEDSDAENKKQVEESPEFSGTTKEGIRQRRESSQKLVDFIKTEQTKQHLHDVRFGRVPCQRHTLFTKSGKTRDDQDELRLAGYGPIADDDQVEEIMDTVMEYLDLWDKSSPLSKVDYSLCVMVPEAIMYAIQHVEGLERMQTEERFYRGVHYFKEEKEQVARQIQRNHRPQSPDSSSDSSQ